MRGAAEEGTSRLQQYMPFDANGALPLHVIACETPAGGHPLLTQQRAGRPETTGGRGRVCSLRLRLGLLHCRPHWLHIITALQH